MKGIFNSWTSVVHKIAILRDVNVTFNLKVFYFDPPPLLFLAETGDI